MVFKRQRADERLVNPPQGNQEPLVVKDKVGIPTGELGVSKSVECDTFLLSVLFVYCWLGDRKGIRPGCWFVGGDDLTGALHVLYSSSCHHHLHHP